jgi:hypothetical protein
MLRATSLNLSNLSLLNRYCIGSVNSRKPPRRPGTVLNLERPNEGSGISHGTHNSTHSGFYKHLDYFGQARWFDQNKGVNVERTAAFSVKDVRCEGCLTLDGRYRLAGCWENIDRHTFAHGSVIL